MSPKISFALLALLLACVATQNVVVVSSSPSTTTVISPPAQSIGLEPYHNQFHPNFLANGAQWIWVAGSQSWPDQYAAVFQTLFYSDCPEAVALLQITADNNFVAYLNGVCVGEGHDWSKIFSFKVRLQCGLNNLTITAKNQHAGSPASLIFSVSQDQSSCYACQDNPSAIYNRKTCKCECSTHCFCPSKAHQWIDYPYCGCKCKKQIFVPCDPTTRFWSEKKCNCECKQKWCPAGQIQDKQTCECVACPVQRCQPGFSWNAKTCSCEPNVCVQTQLCVLNKVWCPIECACVCKDKPKQCAKDQIWDEASCSCIYPVKPC